METKGKFIVFEGIDGSGKSTQIELLSKRMKEKGIPYYTTMEPTEGPIGALIRQVLTGRISMDNKVIAALFAADRLDHLLNDQNGIAGKIESGMHVICDRYYLSSYAYNGVDMPVEWVIAANEQSSRILKPTVHVFIDVEPDTALERIARNRQHIELFEKKSRLEKVRQNYFALFETLKDEKVVVVDGNRPPEQIAEDVWIQIEGLI